MNRSLQANAAMFIRGFIRGLIRGIIRGFIRDKSVRIGMSFGKLRTRG